YNDTHWNGVSMRAGLKVIAQSCLPFIPRLAPEDIVKWTNITSVESAGDLTTLIGLQQSWPRRPLLKLQMTAPPDMTMGESAISSIARYSSLPKGHHGKPVVVERASGHGVAIVFHDSFLRTAISSE